MVTREEMKYILNGYRRAKKQIEISEREIEEVNTMITSIKALDYSKPRVDASVTDSNFQAAMMDKLQTLKTRCELQKRGAVYELENVKALIDSIDDMMQRDILSRRYISLEHWEDMAKSIPADYRNLFRIHDAALDILCHRMPL